MRVGAHPAQASCCRVPLENNSGRSHRGAADRGQPLLLPAAPGWVSSERPKSTEDAPAGCTGRDPWRPAAWEVYVPGRAA